jgi:hypothetical protein
MPFRFQKWMQKNHRPKSMIINSFPQIVVSYLIYHPTHEIAFLSHFNLPL